MSDRSSAKSGCCSCSGETDNQTANPNQTQEKEEDLQGKALSIGVVVGLFLLGLIWRETLQETPYHIGEYLVFIPAYLISGWNVLCNAGRNIRRGRIFDENFLMTVATLGAIAIHELPEAVGVMLFYQVGEFFQEKAVSRSRRSIKSLLEVRPDRATLQKNGQLQEVSPEQVDIGDIILVKPGEKIPLDGKVLEGISQVETSALTGESVPRKVREGEMVLAGMVNQSNTLRIRVTKPFAESSISLMLELVENARSKKAKTEKFITRFARYYTPVVVAISLLTALLPPLFIPGATSQEWIYRALVILVISCPCGLVISIPLGYFGGVGAAAKRGILVKGSTFLDSLTQIGTVVFDKTGTLTKGVFQVQEIVPKNDWNAEELLEIAANAELHSNHPVAKSIRDAYGKTLDPDRASKSEEIAGEGIRALVGDRTILVGNSRLMAREKIACSSPESLGTVVHVAVDNSYAGYLVIADEIKEDAAASIEWLKRQGVDRVMMLTGDNRTVAEKVASQLQLDSYYAELLPEGKVKAIEKLLSTRDTNRKLAFVGDGINDAAAIARADIGIAMGALGSDAAIDTADVVMMTDAPSKVPEAMQIGRKTRQIVWQNIAFALTIKAGFIALGAVGLASMWAAVFADVGVALLAILNAMRLLKLK
ncbi:heavy metal translocating P-type ATPase [Phormidium sp. CCY1219]|uniref:heavy metal translocating P-type ATPase n=1 Tax=Phormidium sp. CCY1219 TaxID=2886104 RepID=UPI002D1E7B12|nr:heavy metal translocating P-type ATPase [Phormidium sp. CCY1219]MEB3828651.1 cadmium-translocating P-type ATPase [Phormidium sp. CCY1219]